MPGDDSFQTISTSGEGLFKDRGSKFLGFAYPIKSEADAREYWLSLKTLHPKAVHACYAYRIGPGRDHFRANDDGEPSGSAGKPILNVLYSRELTNVLVVVVRYFGGTLLGVPGLINAYKTAAELALDEATVTTDYLKRRFRVSFPYASMNVVLKAVKEMELQIRHPVYDLTCQFDIEVREAHKSAFLSKCEKGEGVVLTELSGTT